MKRVVLTAQFALACLLASGVFGCEGESVTAGFDEPFRTKDGQFREGALPGTAPLTGEEITAGVQPTPPYLTTLNFPGSRLAPGEAEKSIGGLASTDTVAVGVRLADSGSGYWLSPVGAADSTNNNELLWGMDLEFSRSLAPGKHVILAAAFDAAGNAGTQSATSDLCLLPAVPDNGNVCDPETPPPALVVSLEWDTDADLDLQVYTPGFVKLVDPKHSTTGTKNEDGDVDPEAEGVGVIDIDSVRDCIPDGHRRENLVFQQKPPLGTYVVYANLFDACGKDSARFQVSLQSAVAGTEEGTYGVAETYRQAGEVLAVQANGGTKVGTFVTEFTVQ